MKIAKLDSSGIYIGSEEIDNAAAKGMEVTVPGENIVPFKYRWNGEQFEPIRTMIALLDSNCVYAGTKEIDLKDLTKEDVQLPDGCDLPLGEYYWSFKHKQFVPCSHRAIFEGEIV